MENSKSQKSRKPVLPAPPTSADLVLTAEEIFLGQTRMLIALGFSEDEAAALIREWELGGERPN